MRRLVCVSKSAPKTETVALRQLRLEETGRRRGEPPTWRQQTPRRRAGWLIQNLSLRPPGHALPFVAVLGAHRSRRRERSVVDRRRSGRVTQFV